MLTRQSTATLREGATPLEGSRNFTSGTLPCSLESSRSARTAFGDFSPVRAPLCIWAMVSSTGLLGTLYGPARTAAERGRAMVPPWSGGELVACSIQSIGSDHRQKARAM